MSQPNPFMSPLSMQGGSGAGGPVKYTKDTGEILAQTRGWAIFRAVLWYLGAALLFVTGLLTARLLGQASALNLLGSTASGIFFQMGLLLGEAVMLTIFAVRVGQYRHTSTPANMLNVLRSLKYFWAINCLFAISIALTAVIDFGRWLF